LFFIEPMDAIGGDGNAAKRGFHLLETRLLFLGSYFCRFREQIEVDAETDAKGAHLGIQVLDLRLLIAAIGGSLLLRTRASRGGDGGGGDCVRGGWREEIEARGTCHVIPRESAVVA